MSAVAMEVSAVGDGTGTDERSLRVLVTVPWGERLGGAEVMLHTLLTASRGSPHQFELVFLTDGPWPRELAEAGFTVTVIEAGRMRQAHRWMLAVMRLANLIRQRQPDIVLNWMAKTQLYGAPAALLAGIRDRVIWWQHGIPTGGWIDRLATAWPAAAVGCSSVAGASAQARLRPARETFVVHPGIATGFPVADPPLDLPKDVPIIGIVGRLQPWKGQDRLLRAHALLRDRGHALHTLVVGGDAYGLSPDYARSLRDLVDQLGLSDEVTLTGHVGDARPYIGQMDMLVNASDSEPFGIVLLEAMAANIPVVAVASGGPSEIIEDGRTGILARTGAPTDLADALERLLGSSELRTRIAQAGYERFLDKFTDDAMCRAIFSALERAGAQSTLSRGGVTA